MKSEMQILHFYLVGQTLDRTGGVFSRQLGFNEIIVKEIRSHRYSIRIRNISREDPISSFLSIFLNVKM